MATKNRKRTALATASLLAAVLAGASASSFAEDLSLSQIPLFVGGNVDPNIMLTLDDSGSMAWSFMPDNVGNRNSTSYPLGSANLRRGLAANWNRLAYNPAITYSVPVDEDGAPINPGTSATRFDRAYDDGYRRHLGTDGSCPHVNLSTTYRPTWGFGTSYTGPAAAFHCNTNVAYPTSYYYSTGDYRVPGYWNGPASTDPVTYVAEPAYYYVFYTNHPDPNQRTRPTDRPNTNFAVCPATTDYANDNCYKKVVLTDASALSATRADMNGDGSVTLADEQQNFANWYSYYRKRHMAAKAGAGKAFTVLPSTGMRVGFGLINRTGTLVQNISQFETTNREAFYDNLYGAPAYGSTPLRRAADEIGRYFQTANPWYDTPHVTGRELQCRQSYHILMSDGYWNSTGASQATGNVDNTNGPSISRPVGVPYQYKPANPFKDLHSSTLADVAMYYWNHDLRTSVRNEVPPNSKDPAFWQHLVTFTVGLGLGGGTGHIDPDDAFFAMRNPTELTITWPQPAADSEFNIDDMLHAAVNSRGGFASAQDPDEFERAMRDALADIIDRIGSAAAVVLNSGTLRSNTRVYQARFDTSDWSGQLLAFALRDDGTVGDRIWDAGSTMPDWDDRKIATYNGTSGVPFEWPSLTSTQKTAIDSVTAATSATSSPVLNFLKGDPSQEERNGGTYRNRPDTILGDIVNSAPLYVGPPPEEYLFDDYPTFKSDNASRDPIIYVGANDGMLHAFSAESGEEQFAFVPSAVFGRLAELKDPSYNSGSGHRYYVDGSPGVADAFFARAPSTTPGWHTILVGGLNAGGQGIYALDITDPDDDDVVAKVLWEFTDQDPGCSSSVGDRADCDLGYTFSQPVVVRVKSGTGSRWVAIFGNGYNNTFDNDADRSVIDEGSGVAALYVVDVANGQLIRKIVIPASVAPDPLGRSRPNGLATVAAVDRDGDYFVDTAYAGDLFGNLWSFDLSAGDNYQTNWKIPYGTTTAPVPLFRAGQPITTRPEVTRPPSGGEGLFVLFGTGKYIEDGDNESTGQPTQTFYAIWDRCAGSPNLASCPNKPTDDTSGKITRNHLLRQTIDLERCVVGGVIRACSDDDAVKYRVTSNNTMKWYLNTGLPNPPGSGTGQVGYLGWYMDLYNTESGNTNNYGERQIANSLARDLRIIFTTAIPNDDPCGFGGSGWVMELDLRDGSRWVSSPFDVNGDGLFTLADLLVGLVDVDGDGDVDTNDRVPPSGVEVGGIPSAPAVVNLSPGASLGIPEDERCNDTCCESLCGEGVTEMKLISESGGAILPILGGGGGAGRTSWHELIR